MNMIKNLYVFVVLSCLYSTTVLAILLGYPGSVSLELKPFSVKVTIKSYPSQNIFDPKLPEGVMYSERRDD